MKKYIYLCLILGMSLPNVYAASAEQYVLAVEEINMQYKQDTRQFLRGLNPQQQGFNPQQQQQFCGIVSRYVDRLYQAADENRAYLDRRYQNINKQVATDSKTRFTMVKMDAEVEDKGDAQ